MQHVENTQKEPDADEQAIYSESYLTLVIVSLFPLFILIYFLFVGAYNGVYIYISSQFLVLYFTGLLKIKPNHVEIWYLFKKSRIIRFEEISKIEFRTAPKSGTNLTLVFKDDRRARMIDENHRPALIKIINHLNAKGIKIQKNADWPRTFDFKNGVYLINEHLK